MFVKTAGQILCMEYGTSKNFVTPNVLKIGKAGPHRAWELSTGTGFTSEQVWGVSVVDYCPETKTTTRRTDLSEMYHTRAEAISHIDNLKEKENVEMSCWV